MGAGGVLTTGGGSHTSGGMGMMMGDHQMMH